MHDDASSSRQQPSSCALVTATGGAYHNSCSSISSFSPPAITAYDHLHAGPEDPRLIVWPGKGLYIMFISKPWAVNPTGTKPSETHCAGPWAQQPWLMPLVTYQQGLPSRRSSSSSSNNGSSDPWLRPELIRLQYLPDQAAAGHVSSRSSIKHHTHSKGKHPVLLKEKNWNPFIYNNELYFSQVRRQLSP